MKNVNKKTKQAAVIFPHQLFKRHPAVDKSRKIFIVEDQLFFKDYHYKANFHKQRLILHRTSMKEYADRLKKEGYETEYTPFSSSKTMAYLFDKLTEQNIDHIHTADPCDFILEKRLNKYADKNRIKVTIHDSPGFLNNVDYLKEYFSKKHSYYMTGFYIDIRKRDSLLLTGDGKPKGGKWSLDRQNRKSLSKNIHVPSIYKPGKSPYQDDAVEYVNRLFLENPGNVKEFIYPTNHEKAEKWLDDFLENRFTLFGDYEDAISKEHTFLFHSVLSPLINTGLLTPGQVLRRAVDFAQENDIPINSLEGFVRQIAGWREFMRAIYILEGVKQRNSNFWNHHNKIPKQFYNAATGIKPVDDAVKRLLSHAYVHHIERLMILGNFMLLCEIDPKEVYRWFMEMFIDAYDWVMAPNVYGMSQYSDGGLITTKPYISSSNYVLKMSDYKKGPWCDIWTGLFWRFVHKHRDVFSSNPRMKMMAVQLGRMDEDRLKRHIKAAEDFLADLF